MASRQYTQATILLSGGLDFVACAHFLQQRGLQLRGLFIDHGQAAARREAAASVALAERLAIPLESRALSNPRRLGAGELLGRNAMLIFNALFLTQGETGLLALGFTRVCLISTARKRLSRRRDACSANSRMAASR